MNKKVLLASLSFSTLLMLSACGTSKKESTKESSSSSASTETVPVQFLAVNDFHGSIDVTGSLHQLDGSEVKNAGTAARLATVLNEAQSKFEKDYSASATQSIRTESGDLVGASPAASGLLQDEPTVKIFNDLDFKVGTLGNHEFDEGLPEFNRLLTGEEWQGNNPMTKKAVQAYKQGKSSMQMVVSNVETTQGKVPFNWKPYTTITVDKGKSDDTKDDVKVGFIGIVTSDIKELVMAKNLQGYKVLDPAKQIVKYSKELEKQGVKAICVLSHTAAGSNKDKSESETEKMIDEVKKLDPKSSVDVVLAGHDHQVQNKEYKDVLITESANQGKAVTNVVAKIDKNSKDFVDKPKVETLVVDDKVKPDPKIEKLTKEAEADVKPIVSKKIAKTKDGKSITEECNENNESVLGDLITDGQLALAKKDGFKAQAAITNTGGIRDDLVVDKDGNITWGSAQAVQPFGNILQVIEIKGKDIREALARSVQQPSKLSLQVSGISYTYEVTKDKKTLKEVKIAGQSLKDQQTYTIVLNDFLCGGGDGYDSLAHNKVIGSLGSDTDAFIEVLQTQKTVQVPKADRKQDMEK